MQENVTDKIKEVVEQDIWGSIKYILNFGFSLGDGEHKIEVTVGLLLIVVISFTAAGFILKWVQKISTRNMDEADQLKFVSFFKFIKYITYIVVVFTVLSVVGVNVTPFLAASAALLVGVGLALQDLFQDIIGGILIMVDKSLLVGDIIEVDGRVGRIIEVKLRTTRAITRDDKIIIIPNHKLIADTIFNYTQNRKITREFIKVGVAYGSDTKKVEELLMLSIFEQKSALKSPKPFVLFEDFGDSALLFTVNFYLNDSFNDPKIKSEIRFRIDALFRENNIEIPFPQRTIHINQHP
jgi:small-conductance mechanosensitive channel